MASFLNAALPSDDEEDMDFVPSENDEDEAPKKPAPKKRKAVRGAAAGAFTTDDASDEEEDEQEKDEIPAHKQAEKKAKVDELWNKLNAKPAAAAQKAASGINLANLCQPVSKQNKGGLDQSWAKQLGIAPKPGGANKPKTAEEKKSAAAAALAAAKAAASVNAAQQLGMVSVTETRRFAGKDIVMTKQVAAGSKEAEKAAEGNDDAAAGKNKNKAGLDAVLASLAQAKKVGVLDKSKADWKQFKQKDDKIDEELELHKKSGDAYLDKQAFLSRAELREYEKERDARLASDVRNRGRL